MGARVSSSRRIRHEIRAEGRTDGCNLSRVQIIRRVGERSGGYSARVCTGCRKTRPGLLGLRIRPGRVRVKFAYADESTRAKAVQMTRDRESSAGADRIRETRDIEERKRKDRTGFLSAFSSQGDRLEIGNSTGGGCNWRDDSMRLILGHPVQLAYQVGRGLPGG